MARAAQGDVWSDWALWIALCAALSPSLVDLAGHWTTQPWALPSAIFAPLWLFCTFRDPSPRRPHSDGYLLLALGLAIAFACTGGGMARLGRPGIPLAIVGLARVLGRPTPARALVAAWMIPVPDVLTDALAPGLESAVGAGAAALARGFGLDASFASGRFSVPAGTLVLEAADGGLPLAALLAGLGWYQAASSGSSLRAAARAALRTALWALPAQAAGLSLACGLAIARAPTLARAVLHCVAWGAAAAIAVLHLRGRAEPSGRMRLDPGALARRAR